MKKKKITVKKTKKIAAKKAARRKVVKNKEVVQKAEPKKKMGKLDRATLSQFKALLLERKSDMASEVDHISADTLKLSQKDASGDISGYSMHMADVATDNFDREFSLGLAGNEMEIIHEIDLALEKIKESTFGFCEICFSPIPKMRLKAVPWARFCIKHQEEMETRGKKV